MMRLLAILSICLFSLALEAREQYQSKQLLDPANNLNESATLSIQELENALNTMDNDYAKASTERHLARHYLKNKEYDKAIAYYENALQTGGLSSYANVEMLGELIAVYLLKEDYRNAVQTIEKFLSQGGKADTNIYLMQAQASYKLKDFIGASEALDNAMASSDKHSSETLNRALSLYYNIGNYNKSANILKQLLNRNPNEAKNWNRLASMYIKLSKQQDALAVLALAWEKNIPFQVNDVLLLSDLYASQNNPHRGARILQAGIDKKVVIPDSRIYQRLFNYWLQAREKTKAIAALQQAASTSQDTELGLYLAQLYMETDQWQKMLNAVLDACQIHIDDRFVGKANLLLGISQLKLGDRETARRSFINATLVGGVNQEAGQYLRFMKAEPVKQREKRYLSGPCQSKSTASVFAKQTYQAPKKQTVKAKEPAGPNTTRDVKTKTAPTQKLFYATLSLTPQQMKEEMTGKAIKLALNATKSGGTINGPMHLIFEEAFSETAETINFKMAFPVAGSPRSRGKNRVTTDKGFKCAYLNYEGSEEGIAKAWEQLYKDTVAAGYEVTGESRQVISNDNQPGAKTVKMELQIGIK